MIKAPARLSVLGLLLLACVGAWLVARRLANAYARPYARVEPGLYIGQAVAQPPKGTEAVVNLSLRPNPYTVQADLWEPMLETGNRPCEASLRRAVEFVAEQRRAGRTTYVHCLAGQNRSGTVVAAYLMREYGWSLEDALAFVRKRRPQGKSGVSPSEYTLLAQRFMVSLRRSSAVPSRFRRPFGRPCETLCPSAAPAGS